MSDANAPVLPGVRRGAARAVVALPVVAALVVGLSACGTERADRCLPAPLTAAPATVAPGGTVTVASPGVDCDLGDGSGRAHVLGIASDELAADGGSTWVEGEGFRVGADGAFTRRLVVPADMPRGPASILVRGSAFDDCDDGEASCAAYLVSIEVG